MKNRIFLLVGMMFLSCLGYAQGALVATLNHNDTVSIYYGASALKDAHSAATDGDVITLSSGTFLATDITKAITLRGAGMEVDTLSGTGTTMLTGDFVIGKSDGTILNGLKIEGIYHNSSLLYYRIKNALFAKCRFKYISGRMGNSSQEMSYIRNSTLIHCRIAKRIELINSSSASFYNCIISSPKCHDSYFINCLIRFSNDNYNVGEATYVYTSLFENCIVYTTISTDDFNDDCMTYNCVGLNSSDLFKNIPNSTNKYSTPAVVFKTYTGQDLGNLDSETFELTDSAKVTFLGTDGTQVGIYGGAFPFTSTTSVPQIKKFNVAPKSTADGKLQVEIEVTAAAEEPEL